MNNQNEPFSVPDGGDKRDRTADLLNAIQALSQTMRPLTPVSDLCVKYCTKIRQRCQVLLKIAVR